MVSHSFLFLWSLYWKYACNTLCPANFENIQTCRFSVSFSRPDTRPLCQCGRKPSPSSSTIPRPRIWRWRYGSWSRGYCWRRVQISCQLNFLSRSSLGEGRATWLFSGHINDASDSIAGGRGHDPEPALSPQELRSRLHPQDEDSSAGKRTNCRTNKWLWTEMNWPS